MKNEKGQAADDSLFFSFSAVSFFSRTKRRRHRRENFIKNE